jgi:glycogen operon protein
MLLGGDEFLRTQEGNNNAYCQDGPVSWHDWRLARDQSGFLRFVREAITWRRIIVPANAWGSAQGRAWGRCWQGFTTAGKPWPLDTPPPDRHAAFLMHTVPVQGAWPTVLHPESDPQWYVLLNAEDDPVLFHLPPLPPAWEWLCVADTSLAPPDDIATAGHGARLPLADRCEAEGRSMVLLRVLRGTA